MWVAVSVGNSPRAFSYSSILPTLPGQRGCQGWPFLLGGHSASSSTSSDSGGPSVWWTPKLPHHGGTCGALIFLMVSPSCWPTTSLLRAEPVTDYSLSSSVPRRAGNGVGPHWVLVELKSCVSIIKFWYGLSLGEALWARCSGLMILGEMVLALGTFYSGRAVSWRV